MPKAGTIQVALIADTHGELDVRVAKEVARCDYAVHAGDIGAAAVLQALRPRRGVVAVRGNNDTPEKWSTSDLTVLRTLAEEGTLELPGGRLTVIHGHQVGAPATRHALLRRRYPDVRAVVYGHSHHRVIDQSQMPWVVNPGAAGRTRTYGGPSLIILKAAVHHWHVEERYFPKPA